MDPVTVIQIKTAKVKIDRVNFALSSALNNTLARLNIVPSSLQI